MIEELENYAQENAVPIIRKESAQFLIDQIKKNNPKNVLEIGTAIGYSGLLILKNCDCKLTTIEKNVERFEIAKKNFSKYNVLDRVCLFCDDAIKVLENLQNDNKKFDFVFLDGPKGQYIKYLPFIKNLLVSNGVLFTDNIYLHGLVKSQQPIAHKHRTMVVNLRKFIKQLENDEDFTTDFYEIEDGISVARLK